MSRTTIRPQRTRGGDVGQHVRDTSDATWVVTQRYEAHGRTADESQRACGKQTTSH